MSKPTTIIQASVRSIAHKFSAECGAIATFHPGRAQIDYPHDLEHPWPRVFEYRTELFGWEPPFAQATLDVEHVLNLFVDEAVELDRYRLAWKNALMSRPISAEDADFSDERIRPCVTIDDVEAGDAIDPERRSAELALNDPRLHLFIAEVDRQVVGKAEIVTVDESVAYVSNMFVHENARRQGLGEALLRQLHRVAAEQGCQTVTLIPSLMARDLKFYERYGYRDFVTMQVFIPNRP